ncbi:MULTISPECIES: hypothetical protein [Lysinibacillus]|uniref:hypothetical protein n=1 Tax=Lysinibacillus TaxID=400634 RepID=UPI0004D6741E|nr:MULTISPECIES: hypothetical protein [Lysinibacillus]AJK85919.1 hypothetical protein HR49_01120 [Lysinibacillus fusiformis]KHK50477.1 hypothetical protein PI85_17545 [Lysinibacillus sp. A1]
MENQLVIKNIDDNLLVSDILSSYQQVISTKSNEVEVKKKSIPNAKGEIITAILVSYGTMASYDLFKMILKRFKNRIDFNIEIKIEINGKVKSLKEIEEEEK